jgi:hypothetical protein
MVRTLSDNVVELQKKVAENTIKIENRNEDEARKDKSYELRSQNKKGKSRKKNNKSSGSDDDDKDPHRPQIIPKNGEDEIDIIDILRNKKHYILINEFGRSEYVDCGKLVCMLREFIKRCNGNNSMNNKEADQYIRNLRYSHSWFNCIRKIKNDPKVNDVRLSDKSLEEVLDDTYKFQHPFIIQCIWPGCTRHFENQDELKKHLSKAHSVGQDELNNHEIYAVMPMYDNNEKYYVKGHAKRYARILQYWEKKKRCLFQHCNYKYHNALNNWIDHVRYFMKEILQLNFSQIPKSKLLMRYLLLGRCY